MAKYENETQSMIENPPNLQCRNYPPATDSMIISLTDIPWYPPYTPDGSHYHNCLEIGLCLAGEGMAEMGGGSWRFSAGALLMAPKGVYHAQHNAGTPFTHWRYIAVDSDRNAYVTGYTTSTATSFPETVGPDLSHNGDFDAFVAKVRADGTALTYCGFIGGSGEEFGPSSGIAVDSSGNAYVTGHTTSTETSFPVIVGPDLSYNGGERDAFVAKVQTDGKGLAYCGYIGGAGGEGGTGIAVDRAGDAYVTGWTVSTETSFPVTVGPDVSANGGGDAFVAKVTTQEFPWPIFLPAILEGGKKE